MKYSKSNVFFYLNSLLNKLLSSLALENIILAKSVTMFNVYPMKTIKKKKPWVLAVEKVLKHIREPHFNIFSV